MLEPGKSRANRPHRDAQGLGDLRVGQVRPREQKEDVPLARPEGGQRQGQRRAGGRGLHAGLHRLVGGVGAQVRVDPGPRIRQQLAPFRPVVVTKEVVGDAEKPWPGVRLGGVVGSASAERHGERLDGQVFGDVGAHPAS